MIETAQAAGSRWSADDVQESTEFLQWLTDDSFIYLGYREYAIAGTGEEATIAVVPGSGLGIMSDDTRSRFATRCRSRSSSRRCAGASSAARSCVVSKTNAETAIHRRARMDYIGVKRIDADGNLVGELRMIGLFTSKAYAESARQIPLVRRKLEAIMRWEDLISGSHDYKAVVELFDSFPKDELFAAPAQELRATIMALAAMQEERNVRVFVRVDPMWRTVWATVALPARPRLDRPPHPARAPVRVPLPGRRRRLRALVRHRPGPVPLHDPRGRRGHPGRAAHRPAARGGRRRAVVGRRPVGRPRRERRRDARPRARAPLRRPLPRVLQERRRRRRGPVRRRAVRAARRRPPLRRRAPERGRPGRAADAGEALQDRRQGAADRAPAAARAARPDRGRGGADAAAGRHGREPLPARLRRARPRRQPARSRRLRRRS